MTDCPSRFSLVQFFAEDAKEPEQALIAQHLLHCETCRLEIAAISKNSASFEENMNERTQTLLQAIALETTASSSKKSRKIPLIAAGITAAAALILGAFFLNYPSVPRTETNKSLSYKGTFSVQIFARRADAQFEVKEDEVLREGDALRFVLSTATPGYLSILSISENGTISPFYPDSNPAESPLPLRIDQAGQTTFPGSIILDDASGTEHLIVLFSTELFDRARIHSRIRTDDLPSNGPKRVDGISAWVIRITKSDE